MKPADMIALVTDAVTDAVRDALPAMIAAALDERLALKVSDRLIEIDRELSRLAAFAPDREALAKLTGEVEALHAALAAGAAALAGEIDGRISAALARLVPSPGPAGPPGPAGAPGAAGRDASFVVPVHFTPGLAVERGAIVQHRGGLWYANAATAAEPGSPVSGYSLVLDGCEPARCEPDEAGVLALVFRFASGVERSVSLGFRPPAYAGVFDQSREYRANDLTTCEGSLWLARKASTGIRPGTDAGALVWTLVVKRGKDGRDGERGPPGERGETGPAGASAPKPKKPNGVTQ